MKTSRPIGPYMESYLIKMGLPAKPKEGQDLLESDPKARARARKHLKRLHRRNQKKDARRHARFGMMPAAQRIG
jgi:hypothetical protein